MLIHLIIGGVIIGVSVFFHALALDLILRKTTQLIKNRQPHIPHFRRALLLASVVLAVFCALIVEMWLWTALYIGLEAFPDIDTALYYSIASFTTAGYGDVVLPPATRLLGSIEAANGFLLFGWSTAFIFEVTQLIYKGKGLK